MLREEASVRVVPLDDAQAVVVEAVPGLGESRLLFVYYVPREQVY